MTTETKSSTSQSDSSRKGKTEASVSSEKGTLEELLASFKGSSDPDKQTDEPKGDSALAKQVEALSKQVEQLTAANAQAKEDADFAVLTKEVKGGADIPDYVIRGWLQVQADENPNLLEVFEKRSENPSAFKKIVSNLQEAFSGEYTERFKPKEPVGAHVRGSREQTPRDTNGFDDVKWEELNDQDFHKQSQALFRQMSRGA